MSHSKPRMLIIGARGFVGATLADAAAPFYEVFSGDCLAAESPEDVTLDITDENSVRAAFDRVTPDVVLLFAAMSDIDRCQTEPALAYAVNVRGAEHVACSAARKNARLLYTSSAAVFDGTRRGYREEDPPTPVSLYGETKAKAEAIIKAAAPSAVVLRLALVLGFAGRSGTNSLLDNLATKWKAVRPVAFPTFEHRNPIDARTLSAFILELLGRPDLRGIYHLGSTDALSRYELGLRLADRMGYSRDLVQAQTEPVPGRAPRGLDHFLLTDKIASVCRTSVPTSAEAIERCFHATTESRP
jgi:dTDP-4-dehydrorhamnose reductase